MSDPTTRLNEALQGRHGYPRGLAQGFWSPDGKWLVLRTRGSRREWRPRHSWVPPRRGYGRHASAPLWAHSGHEIFFGTLRPTTIASSWCGGPARERTKS